MSRLEAQAAAGGPRLTWQKTGLSEGELRADAASIGPCRECLSREMIGKSHADQRRASSWKSATVDRGSRSEEVSLLGKVAETAHQLYAKGVVKTPSTLKVPSLNASPTLHATRSLNKPPALSQRIPSSHRAPNSPQKKSAPPRLSKGVASLIKRFTCLLSTLARNPPPNSLLCSGVLASLSQALRTVMHGAVRAWSQHASPGPRPPRALRAVHQSRVDHVIQRTDEGQRLGRDGGGDGARTEPMPELVAVTPQRGQYHAACDDRNRRSDIRRDESSLSSARALGSTLTPVLLCPPRSSSFPIPPPPLPLSSRSSRKERRAAHG